MSRVVEKIFVKQLCAIFSKLCVAYCAYLYYLL